MPPRVSYFSGIALAFALSGCIHSTSPTPDTLAPQVDLPRFMGTWYVISSIPVSLERHSFNGEESYRLDAKGRILTTYTFRNGSFSAPLKSFHPVGTVYDHQTNAEWRMQFLWPFKSAYLIHDVDPDYQNDDRRRPEPQHVWIMARTPHLSPETYQALVTRAAALGYDVAQLRLVLTTKNNAVREFLPVTRRRSGRAL